MNRSKEKARWSLDAEPLHSSARVTCFPDFLDQPREVSPGDSFPFTGKDQLRLAQFQPETGRPFGTNQAVSLIEIVQAVAP